MVREPSRETVRRVLIALAATAVVSLLAGFALRIVWPQTIEFWLLALGGVAFLVLLVVSGTHLWWPLRGEQSSRGDVGTALMTGGVVAFAILLLQLSTDMRLRDVEERRAASDARQALLLQVAGTNRLAGARFEGRDLRDFYFVGKILTGANFEDADLRRAILSRAILLRADLDGADLREANLTEAFLQDAFLNDADLNDGTILQGACLRGADLQKADLLGADVTAANLSFAQYDEQTRMPDGRTMTCAKPPCRLPQQLVDPDPCARELPRGAIG